MMMTSGDEAAARIFGQDVQPRAVGHLDVAENDVEGPGSNGFEGGGEARRGDGLVVHLLDDLAERIQDERIVVDDQDFGHFFQERKGSFFV